MIKHFWRLYLRLTGWKARNAFPYHLKKFIIIVGPHTSNWDFIISVAIRSALEFEHVKFLGKHQLFKPPFGFIFRWLGGTPVNRQQNKNMVDAVVDMFNTKPEFAIALAPEGTRKRVDRLRTGFYHIAKKAGVPIIMAGLDYKNKEVIFSEPFYTTDNEEKDIENIVRFFSVLQGKNPQNGLQHLLPNASKTA